jgi:hypothetical protein
MIVFLQSSLQNAAGWEVDMHKKLTRRGFGALCGSFAAATCALAQEAAQPRPKVAAVFTELRFRSHAYNILINLLGPYLFRGQKVEPGVEVVSFYADQFPENDMARKVSSRFRIPLYRQIDEALCRGGDRLAVDAVLIIGEHGNYPVNELGQTMYPRKEFFDAAVAVMRKSERYVPIFNDKHLSYRWDWANEMYDTARQHGIPLMAGSSVPLAERKPMLKFPSGAIVEEAVAIHGGGMEVYDFHAAEVLQSLIEFREGGETGIRSVQLLAGEKYQAARDAGRWSVELVAAAMEAEKTEAMPRQSRPPISLPQAPRAGDHALLLEYEDGTKATILRIGSSSDRWNFACRLRGRKEPLAMTFYNGPWGNRNLFNALTNAIIHFFRTGQAPYPIERTLLAGGVAVAGMHSHHAGGQAIDTPHLAIRYKPRDFAAFREDGSSWKVITADTPQPTTFEPGKW